MNIRWHKNFEKHYKKRVTPFPKIESRFKLRIKLFLADPQNPLLRDHQLIGKKSIYRAFWVGGDIRVVYKKINGDIELYDIGSHNQVY